MTLQELEKDRLHAAEDKLKLEKKRLNRLVNLSSTERQRQNSKEQLAVDVNKAEREKESQQMIEELRKELTILKNDRANFEQKLQNMGERSELVLDRELRKQREQIEMEFEQERVYEREMVK